MSIKSSPKLRLSFILSLLLHLAVIAILGFSAFNYTSPLSGDNGSAVDAIMVDPRIMTEQYQRQIQQKNAVQEVERQRQVQAEQRAKALEQQQAAEQERLKQLERERIQALAKQQEETAAARAAEEAKQKAQREAAKAKALLEEQQQQALLAKQKADEEAKARAQREAADKQRIEKERQQAEAEKQNALAEAEKARQQAAELKRKAEEAAKADAEKQKQQQLKSAVNDILGDLTSSRPAARQGVSSTEKNQYIGLVTNAIRNKFTNPHLYSGKSCEINLTIARDGLVIKVSTGQGDPLLCREALSAANKAVIPKPTSDALYQQVKNMQILFQPR